MMFKELTSRATMGSSAIDRPSIMQAVRAHLSTRIDLDIATLSLLGT